MHAPPKSPANLHPVFRAVVQTVVPRAEGFDHSQWAAGESIVRDALSARPEAVRRQLTLFLKVLNVLPVARYLRTFSGLDPARRLAVLKRLERSPVLLLRRGVWGVRTLAFMAVYAQPGVQQAVGYRADPGGWEARRSAADAAQETADSETEEASPPEPQGSGGTAEA